MEPPPPETEEELRLRARRLAGWTLSDLAGHLGQRAPLDLRRAKGWAGEALERALGATSGSQPEPDFPHLGIELKSIPVGHDGLPRESTYVSTVPLIGHAGLRWEGSLVRRKLCRVLFIPVEGARDIPVPLRRIGSPLLWSPVPEEEAVLRRDFEEFEEAAPRRCACGFAPMTRSKDFVFLPRQGAPLNSRSVSHLSTYSTHRAMLHG